MVNLPKIIKVDKFNLKIIFMKMNFNLIAMIIKIIIIMIIYNLIRATKIKKILAKIVNNFKKINKYLIKITAAVKLIKVKMCFIQLLNSQNNQNNIEE